MVSFAEFAIIIGFLWILLVAVANRVDLQKYHLLVSSGFLLYVPSIFKRILHRLARPKKRWESLGDYALLPLFILFLSTPLVFAINLIKSFFYPMAPILLMEVTKVLRLETFLLILPVIAIYLSIQFIIMAIFTLVDGKKIDRSGILLVVLIFTFFSQSNEEPAPKQKLRATAIIIIIQLVLVLLSFPLSSATVSGVNNLYHTSEGVVITYIHPNTPASQSNLELGIIINHIFIIENNIIVTSIPIQSAASYEQSLIRIPAGTRLILNTTEGRIAITGIAPPKGFDRSTGSYLGLDVTDYRPPIFSWIPLLLPLWVKIFFDWMINIGLLFGLYALIPLPKTPGMTILKGLDEKFDLGLNSRDYKVVSTVSFILLISNIVFYVI